MVTEEYQNELEFRVRDYECDLQGIVNNANYQHYIEHARHEWLADLGIDFFTLHEEGIDLIVVRIEMEFKRPLRSRDRFAVRSRMEREGRLKLILRQDIYTLPDEQLSFRARVTAAAIQNGRPAMPAALWEKLAVVAEPR